MARLRQRSGEGTPAYWTDDTWDGYPASRSRLLQHLHDRQVSNPVVLSGDESRQRGYVSVELTPERMTTRFRAVSDATDPGATVSTLKTFVVEDGRADAQSV